MGPVCVLHCNLKAVNNRERKGNFLGWNCGLHNEHSGLMTTWLQCSSVTEPFASHCNAVEETSTLTVCSSSPSLLCIRVEGFEWLLRNILRNDHYCRSLRRHGNCDKPDPVASHLADPALWRSRSAETQTRAGPQWQHVVRGVLFHQELHWVSLLTLFRCVQLCATTWIQDIY